MERALDQLKESVSLIEQGIKGKLDSDNENFDDEAYGIYIANGLRMIVAEIRCALATREANEALYLAFGSLLDSDGMPGRDYDRFA